MKRPKPLTLLIASVLLGALIWPLRADDAHDALDSAPNRDAWDAAREVAQAATTSAPYRLLVFITIDGPDSAKALRAGRDFVRRHPELAFEGMLLANLDLLQRLSGGGTGSDQPDLVRRLQELEQVGADLPMLGAVEPARRLGITHTPSFVLLHGDQAHRIAGIPDLEKFYEDYR